MIQNNLKEVDVIIVGSGMAGLGAARVLYTEGLSLLILEGRNRPGGRVYTQKLPKVDDLPEMDVDLGANYLIGCSNKFTEQPLLGLAKEANIETVTCAGDLVRKYGGWECPEIGSWKNYITGEDIPMEMVVHMSHMYDMTVSLMTAKYYKLSMENKSQWCMKKVFEQSLADILTLYQSHGLRTSASLSKLESGIFEALKSRMLTYQSPLHQLSLDIIHDIALSSNKYTKVFKVKPLTDMDISKWIENIDLRIQSLVENPPCVTTKVISNNEDKLVTNRFSNYIDLLVNDLPVMYNKIVKKIDYRNYKEVFITCIDAQTKEIIKFQCKHCIVTVPVGVLAQLSSVASIHFIPPLPENKLKSIKRLALPFLGAETHNKVVLRYRPTDVFWESRAPHLKSNTEKIHILNFHCYGKPGLLVCHIWGGTEIRTIDYTDEEIVNIMLDLLQGMYQSKGTLPKPIQTIVTRWSEDPFSLGSYTPGGPQSTNEDRKTYGKSLPEIGKPRVLFAGEGVLGDHEAKECTHGALISGMRKAAEIVEIYHPKRALFLDKPSKYLKRKIKLEKKSIIDDSGRSEDGGDSDIKKSKKSVL